MSNQEWLACLRPVCLILGAGLLFFAGIVTITTIATQIRERQMIQNLIDIKRGEFGK